MIQISLKFVPKVETDNTSALVHVMSWCQTDNKPLLEPMMTAQFTNIYASPGLNELTTGWLRQSEVWPPTSASSTNYR